VRRSVAHAEGRRAAVRFLRCHCDNSLGNPFVPRALADQGKDAPIFEVTLGEDTLDEMCRSAIGIMAPNFGF
jgi:DNA-binding transcriptional LysR family regulator